MIISSMKQQLHQTEWQKYRLTNTYRLTFHFRKVVFSSNCWRVFAFFSRKAPYMLANYFTLQNPKTVKTVPNGTVSFVKLLVTLRLSHTNSICIRPISSLIARYATKVWYSHEQSTISRSCQFLHGEIVGTQGTANSFRNSDSFAYCIFFDVSCRYANFPCKISFDNKQ